MLFGSSWKTIMQKEALMWHCQAFSDWILSSASTWVKFLWLIGSMRDQDDYGLWRSVNLFPYRHWILGEEECLGTTWWKRSGKNLQKLAIQYGSMQPWFVTSSNLNWSAYMYHKSPFMISYSRAFNCFVKNNYINCVKWLCINFRHQVFAKYQKAYDLNLKDHRPSTIGWVNWSLFILTRNRVTLLSSKLTTAG